MTANATPKPRSLTRRLLIIVMLVLVVFFSIATVVLDRAFRDAAIQAEQEQLDIQLIALLAAADGDIESGLSLPRELNEQRLQTPGSGLYAEVFDARGESVWRSPSALGLAIPWLQSLSVGTRRFETLSLADDSDLLSFSLAVNWAFDESLSRIYTFHVAESLDSYQSRVGRFRNQLLTWFTAIAAALLLALLFTLRGLLAPLAQIREEISAVETGKRESLSGDYPAELAGVARNLNTLIVRERDRGEVYRRTLGDLAHSLKTPLATVRAQLAQGGSERVSRELDRLDEIIRYQLAKPQTRGRTLGGQPVAIADPLADLMQSFAKIYHDKSVETTTELEPGLQFLGDRGDLLELLGNLIDNAFKRCGRLVHVRMRRLDTGQLEIIVDDDGPGFPAAGEQLLVQRGQRLDETADSHGLGLAIVAEILGVYDAQMSLETAPIGGARVRITFPPA